MRDRRKLSFSTGQISGTSRFKPKRERTRQMVAVTRDLHILASRIPTGFTAIFLAIRYIAQARQVCALLRRSIRHYDSVFFRSIFRSLQLPIFDVIPFAQPNRLSLMELTRARQLSLSTLSRPIAFESPNQRRRWQGFSGFCARQ